MRVLIYGAGVIGSLYAALFSEAGVGTSVYARGRRLESLRQNGLRYEKNGAVCTANVCVLDTLRPNDIYDFIFLTVRENQLHEALAQLRGNQSPCIVTMVNSIEGYTVWEQLCHLAMVVPIADAYYETDDPANAGADQTVMAHTARALRDNFRALAWHGVHLSPAKMQMFRFLPLFLLRSALKITFQSRFGDVFMYRHAMKAPDEMRQLHEQFYAYLAEIQSGRNQ